VQHGTWRALPAFALLGLALLVGPALRAETPLTSERVAMGLQQPLYVTSAPGDSGRVFVVEQPGRIRILDIDAQPPVLVATAFLDISDRVNSAFDEQGLLGLAFHPDFGANGLFYVSYTGAGNELNVARFHAPGATPDEADPGSETPVLSIAQPQANHNGGWMAFGPNDGLLYVATGDGGGGGDDDAGHTPGTGNAQDTTGNLLGKLLRIDVDGSNGPGGRYGIPPDNPFVGVTGDDEIWSYGLRNPWRNAFDRLTGDLYIADVGHGSWEEVDFQPADSDGGENWGWRCREGAHDFNFGASCGGETLLDPILEYSHGGTPFRCSITGGEVYRGCAIPDLRGTYFYADYCSNQIWSFRASGGQVTEARERTAALASSGSTIGEITSFGTDALGELYVVDRGGEIFRIVPDGVPSQCAQRVPATSLPWATALALALLAYAALARLPSRRGMP
jgi:glucose/arabinose dehydrogenase